MTGNPIYTRRSFIKSTVAGGIAVSAAGCVGGLSSGGDGFSIGVLLPLSGPLPALGARMRNGVELAQRQVNEVTIDGSEVNIIVEDSQLSGQTGVSAAQKLVNQDQVPILVGPGASSVVSPVAESVTIPNEVVQITPGGTAVSISALDDNGYSLRTVPSDAYEGRALAALVADNGYGNVAIVHLNDTFGTGLANVFTEVFEQEYGGTVTDQVAFSPETFTPSSVITRSMAGDPGALVFIAFSEDLVALLSEAYEQGVNEAVQYFGASSTNSTSVTDNIEHAAVNGMMGTDPSPPLGSDSWENFLSAYEEAYGESTDAFAGYSYDAMLLASAAVLAADEFTGEALRDAIYPVSRPPGQTVSTFQAASDALAASDEVDLNGVTGTLDLDDAGDVPGQYRAWEVVDGKYEYQGFVQVEK